MGKVKIAIRGLSVPQKIALAQKRQKALTNNPDFPDAAGPLTNYTARSNELEQAHTNRNDLATQLSVAQATLDTAEAAWNQESALLGTYVQMRSGGHDGRIVSGGHEISGRPHKARPLSKPTSVAATMGDQLGCLDLVWDPVDGARVYVVEVCTDPAANAWQQAATTGRSKSALKGLTPGVQYYIRVAPIGATGQGPWSDPAVKVAP